MTNDIHAALARFDGEYLPFPPFVVAKDAIESNLDLFRATGLARHILVLGESGAGKSTLCQWITSQHPRHVLPELDVIRVLLVFVPAGGAISGIAEAMLTALGDPHAASGSISSMTARIVKLCKECRVELILFDESQHLYDRGSSYTQYGKADWLKTVIDKIGVPTVLLGLPRLEQLLQVNEQLRRRFSRRLRLALGQSDDISVEDECLQLFISLANSLELGVSAEPYTWREMGMRLYYACDGRVGYVKKLLAAALRSCLEQGDDRIGVATLERSFSDEIWWEGIGALNPFHSHFAFRRLDRGGEPFQKAQAGLRRGEA